MHVLPALAAPDVGRTLPANAAIQLTHNAAALCPAASACSMAAARRARHHSAASAAAGRTVALGPAMAGPTGACQQLLTDAA